MERDLRNNAGPFFHAFPAQLAPIWHPSRKPLESAPPIPWRPTVASLLKRGGTFYIQWYEGKRKRRRSLGTDSRPIAKEELRQFESAQFRGDPSPLPTRTPVGEVVAAYIEHMKAHRPERSWRKDLTHLREAFGECCPALVLESDRARKCRDQRYPTDRRRKLWPLAASHFEEITTAAVSEFIAERVRVRGLMPKTANRYREVIGKVFNWAMKTDFVRMPLDRNPVARVARYREPAPEIRFLTLEQIDEQLRVLESHPQLQIMVATLIYAGLRREELLWLQTDDIAAPTPQSPNGLIRVRSKTVGGVQWQPKTAKNRVVPISDDLSSFLRLWQPLHSPERWIFPSAHGNRCDADNFCRTLRAANARAGLLWSCLDYRHTFGSQLAQRGLSLFQIATLLGNSPEICRRHYAAIVLENLTAEVQFIHRTPNGVLPIKEI